MKKKNTLAILLTVLLVHSNVQAINYFFIWSAVTYFAKTITPVYSYVSNDLLPKVAFVFSQWRLKKRADEMQTSLNKQDEKLGNVDGTLQQHSSSLQSLHDETDKVSEQVCLLGKETEAHFNDVNTRLEKISVEGGAQHESTTKKLSDIKGNVVSNTSHLESLAVLLKETEERMKVSDELTRKIMLQKFETLKAQQEGLITTEEFENIMTTKLDGQYALFHKMFEGKSQNFNETVSGLDVKMTQMIVLLLGNNCTINSSHRESILQKTADLLTGRQQDGGAGSGSQQSLIACS